MIPTLGTTTQSPPWLIYQYLPQPTRCYIHILCHAPISHELTLRVVNLLLLLCRTYSIFYHKTLYFTQKHSLYLSPSTIVWSTQTAQPPTAITLHPRCPHFILQQPNFSPILSRNPPTTHRIFFDCHNSYPLSLPMHDSSIATDFCIYNERTTTKPSSYHYLPLTTPFITLLSHNNSPPSNLWSYIPLNSPKTRQTLLTTIFTSHPLWAPINLNIYRIFPPHPSFIINPPPPPLLRIHV